MFESSPVCPIRAHPALCLLPAGRCVARHPPFHCE